MRKPLHVLIVEDNHDDLELMLNALRRGGYDPDHARVDDAASLAIALETQTWDVVLTDCVLPRFSGIEAIQTVHDSFGLDTPVIVVSGAIGEETAVELIKSGAQDYVLKDKLARLPVAVEREIEAAAVRRKKLASDRQLLLERENFISIVAHDLRAPVQRVETMAQMLQADYEQQLDEDGRDIVVRIQRSTTRLRLMLASLLSYSKYSRNAIVGKVASLGSIVEEVVTNLTADGIPVTFEIAVDQSEWVMGDAVLIGHVVENLLANAIKFRHKDRAPRVTVAAHHLADGMLEVSVTDNGIGIEPRFAEKVFEIFYRLHDDDEYSGTGIGLAICKKIVRDHGGDIWIDQDFADGTRVIFTLRAAEERRIAG